MEEFYVYCDKDESKDNFYCDHLTEESRHEVLFLNIYKKLLLEDSLLGKELYFYILQYYPDYQWVCEERKSYLFKVMMEIGVRQVQFCSLDSNKEDIFKALLFGEIVTDFLIRYKNYSLIGCAKGKTIVTAQSNCDKRFSSLIGEGYSLQRRAKVGKIINKDKKLNNNEYFYKLNVLPTKDIGYPIDEVIEARDGTYQKVLQKTKIISPK